MLHLQLWKFEAFISPAMYLYGIHYFYNYCVSQQLLKTWQKLWRRLGDVAGTSWRPHGDVVAISTHICLRDVALMWVLAILGFTSLLISCRSRGDASASEILALVTNNRSLSAGFFPIIKSHWYFIFMERIKSSLRQSEKIHPNME